MQKRILVPLDGSTLADLVLGQVRRLIVAKDQEVVLLTVVPEDREPVVTARARQDAQDHLAGVRDALVDQGAVARFEVLVGDAAERILEYAATIQAELIVMGTHGRTGLSRLVRGSVAESVIRRSMTPVLVASPRATSASASGEALRFARILVPLDGSDVALGILPVVEEVAKRNESEVVLLQVDWSVPLPLDGPYATSPIIRSRDEILAALEPVRRRLAAQGITARAVAAFGPEALEIIDTAEREQVDLVAMSTHGRGGIARWIFGSVAEQVLRRCARPLLVRRVHPGREESPTPAPVPAEARTLLAREMLGAKVKDLTLSELGAVDDLVVDPATGRVTYAILRFGGLLGVGEKLFPVPWSRLHWRGDGSFVLQHHGKRREELAHAPHVTRRREDDRVHDRMAALAPAVHSFYPGPRF